MQSTNQEAPVSYKQTPIITTLDEISRIHEIAQAHTMLIIHSGIIPESNFQKLIELRKTLSKNKETELIKKILKVIDNFISIHNFNAISSNDTKVTRSENISN